MWFGNAEDVLVPMAMRPVQFQEIWSRSRAVSGERGLALAVVQEALDDLARYRFARRRRPQRLYAEAYAWVASDDRSWPYSFVNLCEVLGLAVEPIRRRVLTPPLSRASAPAAVGPAPWGKAA